MLCCLYLCGKNNSSKSAIARIISAMVPIQGQQIMSRDFAFSDCIDCNVISSEECYVTQDIVNDIKRCGKAQLS